MCCCPVVEVGLKTKHKILIAPTKDSAEVACILSKMCYCIHSFMIGNTVIMMSDAIDLVTIKKFGRVQLCMWFVNVIMLLCNRGHTYRCQIWVQAGDAFVFFVV